ncbi:MAG: BatA domain-containing protein, partial [Rhodothermales bacterium]
MSFINSIFLFATAAAVLPVLYHLVRRMRARTVPFSSLKFLKATPKELIRKRRLKDRLLMLARAALLALLALVFARPYLPSEQLPFVDQRASE